MAWEIRNHTCTRQDQQLQQRDRISKLPDEILGHILSSPSIPIQDVVITSCLSKRWKTVWTHVDALHIRDDFFRYASDSSQLAGFANFVDVAFDRVVNLRKLELYCNHAYVKQWIGTVTSKIHTHSSSLIEIDLALSGAASRERIVKVHPCVFTSKILRVLKLSFNVEQLLLPSLSSISSTPVCLPCLKVLHISSCMYVSSMENILLGCPVLEELHLSGLGQDMDNMFNNKRLLIKSSSLKRFKLSSLFRIDSRIEVDACNLEELDFSFDPIHPIVVVNTSLLSLTRLILHISLRDTLYSNSHFYGLRLIELLTKAPNTEYLFLSSDAVMCLQCGRIYEQLPVFKNLMNLKLEVCFGSWPIVPWFLERWHNLASFSIREDNSRHYKGNLRQFDDTQPLCSMTTRLDHLEKVELVDFFGFDHEMELVSHILNRAPVLSTMLFTSMTHTRIVASWIHNRVVKLPKASTTCKVVNNFIGSGTKQHG